MKTTLNFHDGVCEFDMDGRKELPISYRSFVPQGHTVKRFAEKGIELFSVFPTGIPTCVGGYYSQYGEVWVGEGEYKWENLDKQIEMFLTNSPNAKFSLMVHLDSREWFLRQHPECNNSFFFLIQMAGYEPWKQSAARFMCDMIDYVEEKYPSRLFSVFLFAGATCEWFTGKPPRELPASEIYQQAYQSFVGRPNAQIPTPDQLEKTENGVFRNPETQGEAIEYWRFHNEQVAQTISFFADIVKKHTNGNLLVGLFYGYIMGLGNDILWRGHNSLKQILDDQNIDIFFAPAQYAWRGLESTSATYLPIESLKLHHKYYWHEVDNTTHLSNNNQYAKILQVSSHRRMETQLQDTMYLRRETAVSMAKGGGYWWFDMFGCWYDDDEMMDEIEKVKLVTEHLWEKGMTSNSQIAVFADEDSNYLLSPFGKLGHDLICRQVEQLARVGTPWDAYLSTDICHPKFPHDQYKLYIFMNQFSVSDEVLLQVKQLRQSGKNIIFSYAPGYVYDGKFSLNMMRDLTGFEFEYSNLSQCKDITLNEGVIADGKEYLYSFSEAVSPVFTTKSGFALGCYTDSSIPGVAIREDEDGFVVWSGVGAIPAELIRVLAKKAGCFIYSESNDPIVANSNIIGLFAHQRGERTLSFETETKLVELYSKEEFTTKSKKISIDFSDDEMKLFEIVKKEHFD